VFLVKLVGTLEIQRSPPSAQEFCLSEVLKCELSGVVKVFATPNSQVTGLIPIWLEEL
jgi:hypothetical protein